MYDSMSERQLDEFASTKRIGKPELHAGQSDPGEEGCKRKRAAKKAAKTRAKNTAKRKSAAKTSAPKKVAKERAAKKRRLLIRHRAARR
jgi:hypothetical protein